MRENTVLIYYCDIIYYIIRDSWIVEFIIIIY